MTPSRQGRWACQQDLNVTNDENSNLPHKPTLSISERDRVRGSRSWWAWSKILRERMPRRLCSPSWIRHCRWPPHLIQAKTATGFWCSCVGCCSSHCKKSAYHSKAWSTPRACAMNIIKLNRGRSERVKISRFQSRSSRSIIRDYIISSAVEGGSGLETRSGR